MIPHIEAPYFYFAQLCNNIQLWIFFNSGNRDFICPENENYCHIWVRAAQSLLSILGGFQICLHGLFRDCLLSTLIHTHTQSRRLLLFCRCLHSRVTDAQTLQFNTHHTTYTVQNHTLESQRSEIFSLKNHYFVKQPLMWMLPDHYRHNLFMSLGYPHVAYRG